MANFQQKFGLRLRELRKRKGLTQETSCRIIKYRVRSVGKIETGNSFPSTETMEKIINVLKFRLLNYLILNIFNQKIL